MESSPSPLVAVLMPVHRPSARDLRQAILSVFQQTVDEWQLVVVDDASRDPEVDRILEWASRDPRDPRWSGLITTEESAERPMPRWRS